MMKKMILASGSSIRAEMLRNAGVNIEVIVAHVDEENIKASMLSQNAQARDIADTLAEMKARRVAMKTPGLVLGADQVLVCEGKLFDKPESFEEAKSQLCALRGKNHELISAAVIFENGAPVWRHISRTRLEMRDFSDAFLENYINTQGKDLLTTVGAYKLEGMGAQLFTQIQGDYFTVLGLPLLEVLGFLRTRGICLT